METVHFIFLIILIWPLSALVGLLLFLSYFARRSGTGIREEWRRKPSDISMLEIISFGLISFVAFMYSIITDLALDLKDRIFGHRE